MCSCPRSDTLTSSGRWPEECLQWKEGGGEEEMPRPQGSVAAPSTCATSDVWSGVMVGGSGGGGERGGGGGGREAVSHMQVQ